MYYYDDNSDNQDGLSESLNEVENFINNSNSNSGNDAGNGYNSGAGDINGALDNSKVNSDNADPKNQTGFSNDGTGSESNAERKTDNENNSSHKKQDESNNNQSAENNEVDNNEAEQLDNDNKPEEEQSDDNKPEEEQLDNDNKPEEEQSDNDNKQGEENEFSNLDESPSKDDIQNDLSDISDNLDREKATQNNANSAQSGAGATSNQPNSNSTQNGSGMSGEKYKANQAGNNPSSAQPPGTEGSLSMPNATGSMNEGVKRAVSGESVSSSSTATAASEAATVNGARATATTASKSVGCITGAIGMIILLIIIIVGLIFFFLAMPGQVMKKFREYGVQIMDVFQSAIKGQEKVVHVEEIADVANYLENMGYDLKGEGFVSSDKKDKVGTGQYYDEDQGVIRDSNTGKVVDLNSDPILTYIVSDNLCYIIKNFNQNLDKATGGDGTFWGWVLGAIGAAALAALAILFSPITAIVSLVGAVVGSYLGFVVANNPDWGTGLISIYYEKDSKFGERGEPYNATGEGWFISGDDKGYIKLTPETKVLEIKREDSKRVYSYNIDGWGGQYGIPLEFLLSLHVASQMPDLAMEVATAFDTDVEVLLRDVKEGSELAYTTDEGHRITLEQMEEVENGGLLDNDVKADDGTINEEMAEILEKMPHGKPCDCIKENGKIIKYGENCKAEFKRIKKLLETIRGILKKFKLWDDFNEKYYIPYVTQVKNHWFRDVYFVIKNPAQEEFAKVDEDYLYLTEERWSVYETYDEDTNGFEAGDFKLYKYEYDENTKKENYTLLTKEQVDEINEKIADGDISVTKPVKKLEVMNLDSNFDNGWWTSYKIEDSTGIWFGIFDLIDEYLESPLREAAKEALASIITEDILRVSYRRYSVASISQVEDGQRKETNSKTKNMFVNNLYYKYDGSITTANRIYEDRKKDGNAPGNYNKSGDSRDPNLLGRFSISKDSLSAFSMLENTHTMDADSIYRDFKELIVELDYFDKEDLSDKIQEVMHWPIPECGVVGWPIRKYEKGEDYYGTLINSKVDITLMRDADIEAAEKLLESYKAETSLGSDETGLSSGVKTGSVEQLVQKGIEVHSQMEQNHFDYCTLGDGRCDHRQIEPECGLDSTIDIALGKHKNSCCATYVSWVLQKAGLMDGVQHSAQGVYNWCKENNWKPITSYSELSEGDLVFFGSESRVSHVQMLGYDGKWLNAGTWNAINTAPHAWNASSEFFIGMRSSLRGAKKRFEGYEPNQAVIAPITGEIVEHGKVTRENIETGEEEEIDFIKIEAINHYLYDEKGEGYKDCKEKSKGEYDRFGEKVKDQNRKNLEGYDYFYDEYQGVCDGFVLYMEGFKLTLFEGDEDTESTKSLIDGGDTSSEKVTLYEANDVHNMLDNQKEAQYLWMEDAKEQAIPYIEIDGKMYIKEGTVIGKTCEDPEIDASKIETRNNQVTGEEEKSYPGNGNYIRLIFRDLEDSIVEDVENYIPRGEEIVEENDWELFFWLPFESGGTDIPNKGPESYSSPTGNEIATGIIQWTVKDSFNNISGEQKFIAKCLEKDSGLCSPLSAFSSWNYSDFRNDYNGAKEFQKAISLICQKDREAFLHLQMEVAKEQYLQPIVEKYPWIASRRSCVQGALMSLNVLRGENGASSFIAQCESKTDEEVMEVVAEGMKDAGATWYTRADKQKAVGLGIVNGKLSEEDIEQWVRNEDYELLKSKGIEISSSIISYLHMNRFLNIDRFLDKRERLAS